MRLREGMLFEGRRFVAPPTEKIGACSAIFSTPPQGGSDRLLYAMTHSEGE